LEAEMLVPRDAEDELGQHAMAASTFLRYSVCVAWREPSGEGQGGLQLADERLEYVTVGEAAEHLTFPHATAWRNGVVANSRRAAPYISREVRDGRPCIKLAQDGVAGRPRLYQADTLPRTVLSGVQALESPTALVARKEMQSWTLLHLEPSSLRKPDDYRADPHLDANGLHMPATLARLCRLDPRGASGDRVAESATSAGAAEARVQATVANRLAELIAGVGSIRVDADPKRETLTIVLRDLAGTDLSTRDLSDGTLRFLALAILEQDPELRGTLCLEEPENGIHPERIPAMLRLLQDISTDAHEPPGPDNPTRQVIVNTHSPLVVANAPDDCLLAATLEPLAHRGAQVLGSVAFRWLPGTWRAVASPAEPCLTRQALLAYMDPLGVADEEGDGAAGPLPTRRVKEREDLQPDLPFPRAGERPR
jgi:predicted ATPase